jgi:hypothetical protein
LSIAPSRGICNPTLILNGFKIRKYNSFGLPLGYAALLAKNFSQAQDRWFLASGLNVFALVSVDEANK